LAWGSSSHEPLNNLHKTPIIAYFSLFLSYNAPQKQKTASTQTPLDELMTLPAFPILLVSWEGQPRPDVRYFDCRAFSAQ